MSGVKNHVESCGFIRQSLVAIDTGANIKFDWLFHVAEFSELGGEGCQAIIRVIITLSPMDHLGAADTYQAEVQVTVVIQFAGQLVLVSLVIANLKGTRMVYFTFTWAIFPGLISITTTHLKLVVQHIIKSCVLQLLSEKPIKMHVEYGLFARVHIM